ncbi:MAG: hypothetical protein AAGF92_21380 [Myxococcota bacterium]
MTTVRIELEVGPLEHPLDGSELDWFETILHGSTDFALVNSGVQMAGFQPDAGVLERRRLKGLFQGVDALTEPGMGYLRLFEWPGTKALDERFMAHGPLTSPVRDFLRRATSRLFETYGGGWDDLCLMQNNRLVFFNCTHEGFGSVFGDRAFFQQLPLSIEPRAPSHAGYRIRGETLDSQLVRNLTAPG